jgi:hypothetical protein
VRSRWVSGVRSGFQASSAPVAGSSANGVGDARPKNLAAGTRHHGLLALDDGPWAVLERRARDGVIDCEEHTLSAVLMLLPRLGFAA